MNLIRADELERLVRATFPGKRQFFAESALGGRAGEPAVAFVHGGPDRSSIASPRRPLCRSPLPW